MKTLLVVMSLTLTGASALAQQAPAKAPAAAPRPAAPAAQAAPAPAPFPAGAKVAFVNVQAIVAGSVEGKADNAKVDALVKKKQGEAAANQKTPQDAQRFQQEAQQEVQKLQQELQADFQRKLMPVLQQMSQEKHLSMLLSAQDAGLIWAEPGLDLTAEAIKRFDAVSAAKK